jgi:hypothetical protein
MLSADYLTRPRVTGTAYEDARYIAISTKDLKADLKRYPRSARWTPDWFATILSPPKPVTPPKKEKDPLETIQFWLDCGYTRAEAKAEAEEHRKLNAELAASEARLAAILARFP